MRDLRKQLIDILNQEVKPAVGCTEPVAVALACAKARELLGEEVVSNKIEVSPNIYKNGMGVGIPGSKRAGLKIAAAMGIVGGHSENGLSVLETLTDDEVRKSEEYMDSNPISITPMATKEKVAIKVVFKGKTHLSKVAIKEKHDNFVYLEKDGNVLLDNDSHNTGETDIDEEQELMSSITVKEIIQNVEKMNFDDIKFLLDGIEMNEKMAKYGLEHKMGVGVGYGIEKSMEKGYLSDDLINLATMLTAGGADARMGGAKMPVMSSNGSGNHGLTAILPIVAYNIKFPQTDERLARALAMSHLVTGYVKNYTGRLSAMCGCGVAASVGAVTGICWLMDLTQEQTEGAIKNIIGELSGIICDGAKAGCALKLSSASSATIRNAIMASQDCIIPDKNGIVETNADNSIRNLGRVSVEGMEVTDKLILDVMNDINKVK